MIYFRLIESNIIIIIFSSINIYCLYLLFSLFPPPAMVGVKLLLISLHCGRPPPPHNHCCCFILNVFVLNCVRFSSSSYRYCRNVAVTVTVFVVSSFSYFSVLLSLLLLSYPPLLHCHFISLLSFVHSIFIYLF